MTFFNLPESETAYGHLAKAFGGGIGQGLSAKLNQMLQEKNRIAKGKSAVQSTLGSIFKQFGADKAYDETTRRKAYNSAFNLLEQGYDPVTASFSAYDEMIRPKEGEIKKKEEPTSFFKTPITKPIESIINKFTEKAPPETRPTRKNVDKILAAREKQGRAPYLKELTSLTRDEFLSLPKPKQIEISKEMGALAKEEAARSFTAGAIPGFEALEKGAAAKDLVTAPGLLGQGPRGLGKATGMLLPVAGLSNIAARAPTLAGRALAGAGLFGGEAALRTALEEGRAPTVGEVALPAAIGGGAELLAPVIGQLWNSIKRIPSAFKSVESAAKVAGKSEPEIVNLAAQNLQNRGVDVLKAAEGDVASLNELQKEVKKVSQTFNEAERFNQKKLLKVREDIAKKLPESPLEKYYAPVKEVKHRPETLAKEEARIAPLRTQISQNEQQLKNLQYQVLKTEGELRNLKGTLPAEGLARLESNLTLNKMQHQKVLNEIKNAEFEIKYGRPPRTSEEIGQEIEKSFGELREGIKDPKAEKLVKVRDRLEKDKEAIETAQKLIARGEIPGAEVFDEYIKIHQQYNKAYGDLVKELKDFVKDNKGKPRMGKKVENADALMKLVNQMKETGEAKIINQIDKRRAMRAIDQPSGAFYRQMLKDAKKDIEAFQRDFFKWKQIASPQEQLTSMIAKKKLPEKAVSGTKLLSSKKIADDTANAIKNPTVVNTEKLATETRLSHDDLLKDLKNIRTGAKEASEIAAAGTSTEKDVISYSKKLMSDFKKLPKMQRIVISGLAFGSLQAIAEEYFGYKPSQSQIALAAGALTRGNIGMRSFAGGLAVPVYSFVRNMFESREAEKLRSLRNTEHFNTYLKKLKDKYSATKVNRIMKKAIG